jgi:hypothetical protein
VCSGTALPFCFVLNSKTVSFSVVFVGRIESANFVARIAGSNPARGMDICLLCLYVLLSCVGRGLCDGLITRPDESYRVSNCVWLRNLKGGGQGPIWAVEPLMDGWMDWENVLVITLTTGIMFLFNFLHFGLWTILWKFSACAPRISVCLSRTLPPLRQGRLRLYFKWNTLTFY